MIAPLIEQDHTPVTEETFEVAEDTLKDRVTSWRKDKLFALLQKMASSGIITINNPPVEDDLQQLELAIANFRCTVGSWRCSSRQYSPTLLRADDSICWHDCIRLRSKWAFECLIFDNDSIEGLNAFMKMLGLDPAVTTASELDALDTRVYCQGCTGEEPTKAYNWRSSVRHLQRHKDCDKPWSGWIKVSDSDAKIIKDGENSGDFSLDGYSPRFICQLCENPRAGECISGIDRERHIQYKHPGHTPAISYYREDPNVAPKPLSVTQVQHVLGYSSVESTAEQSGSGS
ncbi:hypothetical protein FRC03_008057 [Tulasnella sp. 419]|nr:hypothetical protein FRC03_008057 [Tulasnella sp. 419]